MSCQKGTTTTSFLAWKTTTTFFECLAEKQQIQQTKNKNEIKKTLKNTTLEIANKQSQITLAWLVIWPLCNSQLWVRILLV